MKYNYTTTTATISALITLPLYFNQLNQNQFLHAK